MRTLVTKCIYTCNSLLIVYKHFFFFCKFTLTEGSRVDTDCNLPIIFHTRCATLGKINCMVQLIFLKITTLSIILKLLSTNRLNSFIERNKSINDYVNSNNFPFGYETIRFLRCVSIYTYY